MVTPSRSANCWSYDVVVAIGDDQVSWTFLTNHGHVLLALAQDPEVRLRDVATTVGITERAVQAIVADLEAGGYLKRARVGRRNKYTLDHDRSFRHPAEKGHPIGDLLKLFIDDAERAGERAVELAGEPAIADAGATADDLRAF